MLDRKTLISKQSSIIQFIAKQSDKEADMVRKLVTDIVVSHLELMNKDTNQLDIKKQILEKVIKLEEAKKLFERAIKSEICPECAAPLQRCRGVFDGECANFDLRYECIGCAFVYNTTG